MSTSNLVLAVRPYPRPSVPEFAFLHVKPLGTETAWWPPICHVTLPHILQPIIRAGSWPRSNQDRDWWPKFAFLHMQIHICSDASSALTQIPKSLLIRLTRAYRRNAFFPIGSPILVCIMLFPDSWLGGNWRPKFLFDPSQRSSGIQAVYSS